VGIVKPGGTGKPRLAISARFAPLPPSSSRIALLPSARPSPKVNTHLPAAGTVCAGDFLAGAAARGLAIALPAASGNAFRAAGAFFAAVLATTGLATTGFATAGLERGWETDFDETLAMTSVTVCSG